MNIIEAIKSGKPFRRRAHLPGTKAWLAPLDEHKDWNNYFRLDDIMADDWELEEKEVMVNQSKFNLAWIKAASDCQDDSSKELKDLLARELGL